jgi:hypothetical protein
MASKTRSLLALLAAFLFLGAGCVTTDGTSRGSRHDRDKAPEGTVQEPPARFQPAPVKPLEVKPVEPKPAELKPAELKPMQASPRAVRWKTVRLGDMPVQVSIPEDWQVNELAPFRFSLTSRDEGNIIIRTIVNEKKRLSSGKLLHEGILAARELPRRLVWVKPESPIEPFKRGDIWYQEAAYRRSGEGGRRIDGLHVMNANGSVRAHCFMYSLNDDNEKLLRKIADGVTFR